MASIAEDTPTNPKIEKAKKKLIKQQKHDGSRRRGHGFISILPSIVPNIILSYPAYPIFWWYRIIFYTSFKTLDQNLRLNILHKSLLHETKLLL